MEGTGLKWDCLDSLTLIKKLHSHCSELTLSFSQVCTLFQYFLEQTIKVSVLPVIFQSYCKSHQPNKRGREAILKSESVL